MKDSRFTARFIFPGRDQTPAGIEPQRMRDSRSTVFTGKKFAVVITMNRGNIQDERASVGTEVLNGKNRTHEIVADPIVFICDQGVFSNWINAPGPVFEFKHDEHAAPVSLKACQSYTFIQSAHRRGCRPVAGQDGTGLTGPAIQMRVFKRLLQFRRNFLFKEGQCVDRYAVRIRKRDLLHARRMEGERLNGQIICIHQTLEPCMQRLSQSYVRSVKTLKEAVECISGMI